MLLRLLSIVIICFTLGFTPLVGVPVADAGEYEDAKVAFGAFADGLYDFAGSELAQFLVSYPNSQMAARVRRVLVLCSLETGDCLRAAEEFERLQETVKVSDLQFDPATLQLRIGECFLVAEERQRAIVFFTKVIKSAAKSDAAFKARFELARIFFAEQQFTAAHQQVMPLLPLMDSGRASTLKLDRQVICWIAALSSFQLKKYQDALPLLRRITDESAEFSLTFAERQDLYAMAIESAWHSGASEVVVRFLQHWLQIPKAELEVSRLTSASLLAADLLRSEKCLAKIRSELIRVAGFAVVKADEIALYELLLEIDSQSGEQKALKAWLEALLSLQPVGAQTRVAYLESLLLLNFQIGDYRGAVLSGRQLIREKPGFWADEKLYFHFIVALGQLDKCRDIVKIVPLKLPSYGAKEESLLSQRRLVLDMMAGRCLSKLGRFGDAKVFYRSLYAHYNESAVRLKLLALLYRLADKIQERKELDEWVSSQVMGHFSLDRREDVKLLRESPELVLLVAERLFRERLYLKVLPSLLWLDKLGLESELGERVTFLLAESYYRCEEVAEALVRFEILYAGGSKKIRYLAALRLVILYEAQGGETEGCQDKLKKLYQDLLAWESDPAARLELERKLIELK